MEQVSERERLRQTFDAVAGDYQGARPEYPDELYAALLALSGARPETDALCEVGCASGKATLPLARRGFSVTCVELGTALAAEARRNLASFPRVTVVNAGFETWQPATVPSAWVGPAGSGGRADRGRRAGSGEDDEISGFGLVFAATAWHWIDPSVKYQKAASLLRPGGHLAFWGAGHVIPGDGDPFFREIQDVYDEIGEGMPGDWVPPTVETLPSFEAEISETGLFSDVVTRRFQWEIRYTADGYIRLLETFSSNLVMERWQRERLYGEIRRRLASRPDGLVRRHWGAVLHVARKRSAVTAE